MKVSVAICTYNGSKYIEEQLTSIINQTRKPDEIVLCDDNSVDNTIELAERILRNSNIDYTVNVNKSNLGVVKNFSQAMSLCTGDVIFTSDQDDVWVDNKVRKILDVMEEDVVLVFTDAYTTDKNLNTIGGLWDSIGFSNKWQQLYRAHPYNVLFTKNFVTGATMAFKKSFAERSIPMPEERLCLHDYWLALAAPIYGKTVFLEDKLLYYRLHGANTVGAEKLSVRKKIKRWFGNLKTDYYRNLANCELSAYLIAAFSKEMTGEDKRKVRGWNEFCVWRKANAHRWFTGIVSVVRHSMMGDYRKYSRMFMPELKDMAVNLFRLYK